MADTFPVRENHTFLGWYSDPNLSQKYDFSQPVFAPLTLYAKWRADKYEVQFVSNGGSEVPTQTVEHGKAAQVPKAPTPSA